MNLSQEILIPATPPDVPRTSVPAKPALPPRPVLPPVQNLLRGRGSSILAGMPNTLQLNQNLTKLVNNQLQGQQGKK